MDVSNLKECLVTDILHYIINPNRDSTHSQIRKDLQRMIGHILDTYKVMSENDLFVEHVKRHLDEYKEQGIPMEHYDVMCKICLKTIDEIYDEESTTCLDCWKYGSCNGTLPTGDENKKSFWFMPCKKFENERRKV